MKALVIVVFVLNGSPSAMSYVDKITSYSGCVKAREEDEIRPVFNDYLGGQRVISKVIQCQAVEAEDMAKLNGGFERD